MSGLFIHKFEAYKSVQYQNETGGIETVLEKIGEFKGYLKEGKARPTKGGDEAGTYFISSKILAERGSISFDSGLNVGCIVKYALRSFKVINIVPKDFHGRVVEINVVGKL